MPNDQKQNQAPQENNSFSAVARHNARRYALQAMYQWQMAGTSLAELENEFLNYHVDKKIDLEYFKALIHGIPAHRLEIDQTMESHLGRPLNEIDPIELAVLRVATFELLKCPEVPYRVIINEALELTKKFGSIEGHKFVNGVLDKVAKNTRKTEIKMDRRQR
jgi:N utilization substance protein B